MPHQLKYRPIIVDDLISIPRIGSYQAIFSAAGDVELVGAYLWNSHVCASIYPLVATVEVALRNAIDSILKANIGTFWWSRLHYKSFTPGSPKPDVVERLGKNFVAATKKYRNEKHKRYQARWPIPPQHDGIIAKTEFSTWELMLDDEFKGTAPGTNLIWPRHLGKVFRGPWPSKSASTTLRTARDLVATIRDFRNRLFHHEPAWKGFGVASEQAAIQHLHDKIQCIEDLLTLIHPEKLLLLQRNGIFATAYRACSIPELRRFQHCAPEYKVASTGKLATLAKKSHAENVGILTKTYKHGAQRFLITPI